MGFDPLSERGIPGDKQVRDWKRLNSVRTKSWPSIPTPSVGSS
jgi:hypothetical protein